jgi:hypothetical protein
MCNIEKNVVARFQSKIAMPTLIRNVAGHNWGWFSQEDQRMHLQTVEAEARSGPNKAKIWLESKGKRIFELATGDISGPDLKRLKAKVDSERSILEAKWISLMIHHEWIKAELEGHIVVVTAYPNTHNKFSRKLDLKKFYPGCYPNWNKYPPIVDFDDNGMLRIGNDKNPDYRDSIALEDYLFVG